MLPCNVIVQEREDGTCEVSAVDPVASMAAVENPAVAEIAQEVRLVLSAFVQELGTQQPDSSGH